MIGRLVFRMEGANWNAYWCPNQDNMMDAVFIGSIQMVAVTERKERKAAFMALMRECFGDVVEKAIGKRPTWGDPKPASENE